MLGIPEKSQALHHHEVFVVISHALKEELPAIRAVFNGERGKWVDLTHAFSEDTIYWPTDTRGFQLDELAHGHTEGGWFYSSYRFSTAEHGFFSKSV